MIKVLVADADPSTATLVEQVLKDKLDGMRIVGVAKNGNDAVIETINKEPDLIIIAVKMAGLNGLETIRQIRSFNKGVHILITSAYDYFDFAREALLLGVNNYILKPLSVQQLTAAMQKELLSLTEESERIRKFREEEHIYNTALHFVEHNFIYGILFNPSYGAELDEYIKLIGVGRIGYIMNVEIKGDYQEQYLDINRVVSQIQKKLKTIISTREACAVGPQMMHRIITYVSVDKSKDAKEVQIESVKLAKQVHAGLKETFGIDTFIGIGTVKHLDSIHESYLESIRCTKYSQENSFIHYKEIRYKDSVGNHEYGDLIRNLVESIKYSRKESNDIFTDIIESLRPMPSIERISHLIELLFIVSYESKKEYRGQTLECDFYLDYYEVLNYTVEEQETWAWRRFSTMLRAVKYEKSNRKSNVISVAMNHMNRHYTEEVTLNDIAAYVNLSPQHFSKMFKEETGFGYVEWINNLRITKARELMNNTDKTIKEICYQVGYHDPNYFSRIFKKYVGISPTDYMQERDRTEVD